jgi:hypothetical protein
MIDKAVEDSDRVGFRIPPELRARIEEALAAIREDPADRARVEDLVEIVLELTDFGLDYYYLEPLRRAGLGAMGMVPARMGIATVGRGFPPIVRRVLLSLDEEQILEIAGFIEDLLVPAAPR